jgi:hypothetical protein
MVLQSLKTQLKAAFGYDYLYEVAEDAEAEMLNVKKTS